ncbi:putative membrane protein [Diplodia seriata]|uniref:Putative membrane protein n=1 Tax=Diplodia seriata TaxID=420778 RepID=A0A0G2EK32_9PEZI|nr:putative membrane protein [Diplodia seriata]
MSGSFKDQNMDLITRGSYKSTPGGTAIFIGLRALDPLLQYGILAHGLGANLLDAVGLGARPPPLLSLRTGVHLIDVLDLSAPRLALLAMAVGSSLKQIHWLTFLSREEFPAKAALTVGVFNTVVNSINTLAFCSSLLTTASPPHDISESSLAPVAVAGSVLYVVGLAIEWISEIQRARFKADPANEGKPYSGGLWRLARHINYGGYSLWRAGFAMTGGGWVMGSIFGGFYMWDFATRAIPVLDSYCSRRYGEDWKKFKEQTPYRLLPFIY